MWMTDEDQRPLAATDIIALLDVDLLSFYLSGLQVESILPQNSYLRSSYHRGLWEGNYLPFMVAAAAAVLACIVVTMVYFYGKRSKPSKKGHPDLDQMCVYPGVKPVVKTTKVIQPDSPKSTPSSSISASPSPSPAYRGSPKAGKPKGLQERRGSNVSLSIDLPMPPMSADAVKCGTPPKESVVDELLQSGTRKMTRSELRKSILNAKALYGEFWEIPMNHPEQVEIPGCGTKNRYKTILPNAHSRVVLPEMDNDLLTSYINANYVKGYDMEERAYIATQGPMNHTVTDFWQMVWHERTPIIVMITKLTEKNEKCAHYWPDLEDRYGDIVVSVNRVVEHDGYILRHFTLQISVSTTFQIGGLMPVILNESKDRDVDTDHLIHGSQHGFRPGRSTVSALNHITQTWHDALNNKPKMDVHVSFIDFSRAFDTIDHGSLLHSLAIMGVRRDLWCCLRSYLSDRVQRVRWGSRVSSPRPVLAGTPQGGIISPSLFVLAMNSLDKGIPISVAPVKYADDLTNTELLMGSLPGQMQLAINEVDSWAKSYSMAANVKKTKDMVISCRKEAVNPPPLTLNGERVERVRKFKLLGVIVSDDLSWGPHIDYILSKVRPRLHYLRLSKRAGLPADVLLDIYKAFIRPVLEYGSPVWGGLPRGLAEELEKVQRSCCRIISIPYEQLPTLESRRREATTRELRRLRGNEVHYIRHYWCTEWPDHKTPETAKALLALVQEVEFHRLRQTRPRRPVVVHCSAGIGRTGCFIATSIGIRQLREENTVDVLSIVCGMRQDRGGMVQTNEQYEFIHYALCQFEKTLPSEGVD
ncbi:PTPRR [Branchiostoma lanceolatum]|nr:PTPRR [Branchiostoma lanceolatum]